MTLAPIERRDIPLVAGWLADPANHRWLDFGNGHQPVTPVMLAVMLQRPANVLRVVVPDETVMPIGIVALSNVDQAFKTANLWYVLGDKGYAGRGCTTRAVSQILNLAFHDLRLEAVSAWAVETNIASVRVLERNHFRMIGRQRRCHDVDGRPLDRLLFDLLAWEHHEA